MIAQKRRLRLCPPHIGHVQYGCRLLFGLMIISGNIETVANIILKMLLIFAGLPQSKFQPLAISSPLRICRWNQITF